MTESKKRTRESLRAKKTVSFAPNVLMYRTKHINDYTDEEVRNCWYNEQETRDIVSDCMKTISAVKNGVSTTRCLRGLEYRFPEGHEKRAANKFGAMDAVLDEQEIQWQYDLNDVDEIRSAYSTYSIPCHAEASHLGLQDEIEAMLIYSECSNMLQILKGRTNVSALSNEIILSISMKLKKVALAKITARTLPRICSPIGRAA